MATTPNTGQQDAAALREGGWRWIVVCQILGLAALALIIFMVLGGHYSVLRYAAIIAPMLLIIPKPSLTPYVFVLSFFTIFVVYESGRMLCVTGTDIVFLVLILAFISRNRIDLGVVNGEHRRLFTMLALFMLWAAVGYIVNFYTHGPLENFTSAFFVLNIAQLVAAVVLLSQPRWESLREKIIAFYLVCVCAEIAAALALELLDGASSLSEFTRMSGTLGGHHGMLSNVLILSFGVAAGACFTLNGRLWRWLAGCTCAASAGVLLLSGSRGSIMGLVLAMPATALLGYRLRKKTLLILLLSAAAALAIFWFSPLRGLTVNMMNMQAADNVDLSAYGRLLIWERVYEHALYGPWLQKIFGIGIGTFNTLRFNYFLEVGAFTTGAHNNFLHAFVEVGIVGLAIYLGIFVEIVRRLVVRSRRGDNAARCFLVATLVLLFSCLTQETLWFNRSFGRFWLMYLSFYLIMFNNYSTNRPIL